MLGFKTLLDEDEETENIKIFYLSQERSVFSERWCIGFDGHKSSAYCSITNS